MKNLDTTVAKLAPSSLASLFEMVSDADPQSPQTLQEALEHLLSLPIENAVSQLPRSLAAKLRKRSHSLRAASRAQPANFDTFGELLAHPHPPLEWLKFAKAFGKEVAISGSTIWPEAVGRVLNYAAYAAALVSWNNRIGTLADTDLERGFRQLAVCEWIGEELRLLFQKASAHRVGARSSRPR